MTEESSRPTFRFVGDQGLPMAVSIARATRLGSPHRFS